MRNRRALAWAGFVLALLSMLGSPAVAEAPTPKEEVWTLSDFKFGTGEALPALKLAYTTLGDPAGEPVLVLHGTTGSGSGLLAPGFGGELFAPGQPLDASKYFIILSDAFGHGKSFKT